MWLLDRSTWPTWTPTSALHLQAESEDSPTPLVQQTEDSTPCLLSIIDTSRYSNIYHLLAVTAYIFRFVHNLCKEQHRVSGPLFSSELVKARQCLIKGTQGMTYHEELSYLLKRQSKCPPLIRQLHLFLDNDKLIRCGGRIHNHPTTELAKFPVLLPANSSFTNLIIMDTHSKHGGIMSITVTALRQVYWIPSIRREDV